MPTDQTPRDDDETLAVPVTDAEPTSAETVVIPVDDEAAQTVAVPADDAAPTAGETAVLSLDETRPMPVTAGTSTKAPDEIPPFGSAEPVPDPVASTSPIGALYSPADRPPPVAPSTPADPVPVHEPAAPARRLRVGTVVWGLVIAAIGVGLLAWAAGVEIDVQLAMIVLLAAAGVALLVGSIVSGARHARR